MTTEESVRLAHKLAEQGKPLGDAIKNVSPTTRDKMIAEWNVTKKGN